VAARLKLVNQQIKQAHRRLDELADHCAGSKTGRRAGQKSEQRDVTILRSLPGVGRIVLATLLGEAAEPLRTREDYHTLRTLAGVAPVTRRSGKRRVVTCAMPAICGCARPPTIGARVAIQHDARSRTRYGALRQRGHSHGRALAQRRRPPPRRRLRHAQTQTVFNPEHAAEAADA